MPQNILSSNASRQMFLAFNEVDGRQCWKNLKVIDVEVSMSSANTNKPVAKEDLTEVGIFESLMAQDVESIKILEPSTLRITAIAPDIDTLEGVLANFADTTVTMGIITKSIVTRSLVVTSVDVEQTGEMLSASRILISLEQAQPPQFSSFDPEQAADASLYGTTIIVPPSLSLNIAVAFNRTLAAFGLPNVPEFVDGALIDQAGGPFILDVSKLA